MSTERRTLAEGDLIVDDHYLVLRRVDQDELVIPEWDDDAENGDLGKQVGVLEGYGIALPVRSSFGPVSVTVVETDDVDPEQMADAQFVWNGVITLGATLICVESLSSTPTSLSEIQLLTPTSKVSVGWFYSAREAAEADKFEESLLVSFSTIVGAP